MDELLEKLSHYGYPGLFAALMFGIAGLPIPDETLLVICGYLVSKGNMHPVLTWITALLGSWSGITISYLIGRYFGYGFIHRYGRYIRLGEPQLKRVEQWFDRIGHWLLTVGYYIPAVRHFTALVGGMMGMNFKSFATFAYPGAALWISTFIGIGYFVGDNWKVVVETVTHGVSLAVLIVVLLAGAIWYWRARNQAKRRSRQSD